MWTNQQTTTSSLLTPEGGYLSLAESQRLKDLNALNLLYTRPRSGSTGSPG